MATLTVGPHSSFPTIAAAMQAAGPGDTIRLESGYRNETATVTHNGMTVSGDATSTGIVLRLATTPTIATFTLAGTAPITVRDAADADGNSIAGNAGNNLITVTAGADAVNGGAGIDRLVVDYRLATGAVTGDSTSNVSEAGGGGRLVTITNGTFEHFTILTGAGADTITTGSGNDIIDTGNGAGTVTAGQGANRVTGGSGADTITTLDGGNVIDGGDGANTITSGGGNDVITSGIGADTIVAGGGDDAITVRGGADSSDSGAGVDRLVVVYSASNTAVTGGITGGNLQSGYTGHIADLVGNTIDFVKTENFTITTGSGNDVIATGDGIDVLNGGAGNDILNSGSGNDTLNGGTGTDRMSGGAGNDLYIANNSSDVVTENANAGRDHVQAGGVRYTLQANVENLTLTGGASDGFGNSLNNVITGNSVANLLSGGSGNDTLGGGLGNDTLAGGAGSDRFFFNTALNGGTNVDVISDFNPVADALRLDDVVFTGLALGTLASSAFRSGTQARDSSDRVIYNPGTGAVLFDADGTGATAAVRFAMLDADLAITNSDFIVV